MITLLFFSPVSFPVLNSSLQWPFNGCFALHTSVLSLFYRNCTEVISTLSTGSPGGSISLYAALWVLCSPVMTEQHNPKTNHNVLSVPLKELFCHLHRWVWKSPVLFTQKLYSCQLNQKCPLTAQSQQPMKTLTLEQLSTQVSLSANHGCSLSGFILLERERKRDRWKTRAHEQYRAFVVVWTMIPKILTCLSSS